MQHEISADRPTSSRSGSSSDWPWQEVVVVLVLYGALFVMIW